MKALIAALAAGTLAALPAEQLSAQAQTVDRSRPPALGPAPALRVPAAQTARLSNGLEIVVLPMHEVPIVNVNLIIGAGSVRDPRDLPGLATFTANMLDEGAGRRSALEIAEESAFLSAQLNASAAAEWATVSVHTP